MPGLPPLLSATSSYPPPVKRIFYNFIISI
jgi:hypothetical protein